MEPSLAPAAGSRQPEHPSPSRSRFALFPLLPQNWKSLFAAPRIRFSFSALVLPQTPSRANPSPGCLPLLLPSLRRRRPAAKKRSLSLPLLQQPLLLCRISNRAPTPAGALLRTRDPLQAQLPAIPADSQRPAVAILR